MTDKQKLCPLCGRDMTAIETHPGRGELYCGHCDLTIGGNDAKTPEELMALMDGSEHRRLQVENDRLLEQIHWLKKGDILHVLTDQEYIDQYERERLMQVSIDALDKENAELRELAVLNWEWAHSCCANSCKMQTDGCGYGIDRECNYEREIADLMRELGIEAGK